MAIIDSITILIYNERVSAIKIDKKRGKNMRDNTINPNINDFNEAEQSDDVKVFEGLTQSAVVRNTQLLNILDLNAEQLTYYLEEAILENPFIDLDYALESRVAQVEEREGDATILGIDPQLPRLPQSLPTFLFEQIMLFRQTEIRDTMIKIVDYLDDRGYLPYTYEELAEILKTSPMTVLDAITLVKQLEPAGVGAANLQESLMLQTEQDNHAPNVAYYLLEDFFEALSEQDYAEIVEKTNLTYDEIKTCVNYFHTLRPSPATLFDRQTKINLIPDVTIARSGENMVVRYNRQYYPRITFNQIYYDEMKAKNDPELMAYIETHYQNYLQLAENLRYRERLIVDITQVIVLAQKAYFLKESAEIAPLLIKDIAEKVRLSEPVVNLIVTNKNIEIEKYVCPLTDFINASMKQNRGGLTAFNIKQMIYDILSQQADSISDPEVVELLGQQKIIISEQMVHNYRQGLGK